MFFELTSNSFEKIEKLNSLNEKLELLSKNYLDLNDDRLIETYHQLIILKHQDRRKTFKTKLVRALPFFFTQKTVELNKKQDSVQEKNRVLRKKIKNIYQEFLNIKPRKELAYVVCLSKLSKKFNCPEMDETEKTQVKNIFNVIYSNSNNFKFIKQTMAEVLKGAHVKILDDGNFYDQFSKNEGVAARKSSHYRKFKKISPPQFGLEGKFVHEILCGKIKNKKTGDDFSWFQLESHPHRPKEFNLNRYLHYFDWLKYTLFKKNVGPYGLSAYRDSNPLVLRKSLDDR